jgi:hypothetical protein
MYRNCIFCSADFGTNDALESFPVGRQLAFDSWKGRLWAVCPACARWNLSPLEERWETVEQAEKLFRDARLRVQSENVGLARLRDGTRLVRVGSAVPGELAAWRYGTQLLRRRRRYLVVTGTLVAAGAAFWGGLTAMGAGVGSVWIGLGAVKRRLDRRVLYRVAPADDPRGHGAIIRRWHLGGMDLQAGGGGLLQVRVREPYYRQPSRRLGSLPADAGEIMVVSGDTARALLARAMVLVNRKGANRTTLQQAESILGDAGSAERLLREAAAGRAALGSRAGPDPRVLQGPGALAFEMALNEEAERRALEGELAALEAAWREAEEIAAIADSLPGEALLNRLLQELARR